MEKKKKEKRISYIKGAFPVIAIVFLFLLYAPLELYSANVDGFIYDIYDLFRIMFPLFIVLSLLAAAAFLLIGRMSEKLYSAAVVLSLWVLISVYIQGTFFSNHLPPLDGRTISWSEYDLQRIPSVLIWLGTAAVILLSLKFLGRIRFNRLASGFSLFLIAMLTVSAVIVLSSGESMRDKKDLLVTDDHMLDLSEKENFVILLTDCIGGSDFDSLRSENPEYSRQLEDFTFFRNTVGCYPFTQYAVPYILCGEWYENDESFYTYKDRAYAASPLIDELRARDYKIGVYEQDLPTSEKAVGDFENTVVSDAKRFNAPVQFLKTQIKLVGLKYFPYDLKRFCLVAPDFLYANSLKKYDESGVYDWTNLAFYTSVRNKDISSTKDRSFRFIHISGAHDPFIYDKDMNVVDSSSYEECVCATLKCVDAYLNLLKSSGFYDNSVIIIMADHGYYEESRHNPLLLVKGNGETHDFAVSDAPISYSDLQEAYVRLMDGSAAEAAFPWREGDSRDRRFLDYLFYSEDDMREYIQHGYAVNQDTFEETGNRYIREGEHITLHSFFDW